MFISISFTKVPLTILFVVITQRSQRADPNLDRYATQHIAHILRAISHTFFKIRHETILKLGKIMNL